MKSPFTTSSGERVIAQPVNPPMYASVILWLLSNWGTSGDALFYTLSLTSLLPWAVLELTTGVNLWRRILGAAVLAFAGILQLRLIT